MKQTFFGTIILLFFCILLSCQQKKTFSEKEISIIPQVQKMTLGESSFEFNKSTQIVVENNQQEGIAGLFAGLFEKGAGWKPQITIGGSEGSNQVYFKTETTLADEAYSLKVYRNRIEIRAANGAGFYYGLQSLRQLLPVEIESSLKNENIKWRVPVITISDEPTFKWRGYMLDVSRHFFTKDEVLGLIDHLALHKINTLHLHLLDDQGWRIEIKKYQKLTEIGAWRVNREDKLWN